MSIARVNAAIAQFQSNRGSIAAIEAAVGAEAGPAETAAIAQFARQNHTPEVRDLSERVSQNRRYFVENYAQVPRICAPFLRLAVYGAAGAAVANTVVESAVLFGLSAGLAVPGAGIGGYCVGSIGYARLRDDEADEE